jgi:hypothetical protein
MVSDSMSAGVPAAPTAGLLLQQVVRRWGGQATAGHTLLALPVALGRPALSTSNPDKKGGAQGHVMSGWQLVGGNMTTLGSAAGVTTAGEQRTAACSQICVLAPVPVLDLGWIHCQVTNRLCVRAFGIRSSRTASGAACGIWLL